MASKKRKPKGSKSRASFLNDLGVKYSKELSIKATSWELDFKEKLDKADIHYAFQYPVVWEQSELYILDFYIPEHKIAFELDGAHHLEKVKAREDARRTRNLAKMGIKVKRIMNKDVKHVTPQMVQAYIQTHLLKK